MKNGLIKLLMRLPIRKNEGDHKSILVVSTTGLGDSMWGTPALRFLKKRYPEAKIALLTSPIGAEVFRKYRTFVVGKPALSSLLKLFWKMKREKFDTAYIFHTSQRPILPFVKLLGPSRIIGTKGINKGLDSLLTHPFEKTYQHEILRRNELVGGGDTQMEVESVIVKPFDGIGMHIGANAPFKQWPIEKFIELGKRLGKPIVLTGVKSELPILEKVARELDAKIFTGTLSELAGMMKHLSLFITNDTGPMHVAIASGTRTIALFGPTDPNLCGPLNAPHATVISKPKTCTPCLKQKCRDAFCMEQITVADVLEKN